MARIGKRQTLQLLRKAARDYGKDWIDPNGEFGSCKYDYELDGQERHCIAGYVFNELGIEIPVENQSDIVEQLPTEIQDKFTPAALIALTTAQDMQDVGERWGSAVKAAELAD